MTDEQIDQGVDARLASLPVSVAEDATRWLDTLQTLDRYYTLAEPVPGQISLDPYRYDPVVVDLMGWLSANKLVARGFAWSSWDEGRQLRAEDMAARPARDAIKLITAVLRNDRFCSGAFVGSLDSGLIQACLARVAAHLFELDRRR